MLATRSISQLICYKCNKINQPIYWSDITAVAYNKAIYILQAIDVNHQKYNNFKIFCNQTSNYKGPLQLGGAGGSQKVIQND